MASTNVEEAGLEPVQQAPSTLLSDLLDEGMCDTFLHRGYSIVKLTDAAKEAINRLRESQTNFFATPRDNLLKFSRCHPVNTHGVSEVLDLKYYFQARSGGHHSDLPFPGPTTEFAGDFGVDVCDVYTHLDLLGRACLKELAPRLNIPFEKITDLMDPLGRPHSKKKSPKLQKLSTTEILDLDFRSVREGEHVWSELFVDNYVSSSNLDLFYYHNIKATKEKWALNHPAHTDSGIISFIPVSTIPALDFFDQKLNCWIAIEKVVHEQAKERGESYKDYVIAMAGDTLQTLAKNTFKAGLHRVVRTKKPRESAVYKLRARPELVGPKYEVDYKVVQVQRKALGMPEI